MDGPGNTSYTRLQTARENGNRAMRDLGGKVAVVTGAASGIGRATAEALSRKGCRLALVDIDAVGLEATRERIGGSASVHVVDVADPAAMRSLPDVVVGRHRTIDVLVNNAGVNVSASLDDHSTDDLEWIIGVNLWGVIYGCKFFTPYLAKQDVAHIVNVSSLYGLAGVPHQASYCASKFAVRGLSESLRIELRGKGIGVTCAYPAGIASDIVRNARFPGAEAACRDKAIKRHDRLMSADYAARAIVKAIEDNRARVLIAPQTHVIDTLVRWFPNASAALQGRLWSLTKSS